MSQERLGFKWTGDDEKDVIEEMPSSLLGTKDDWQPRDLFESIGRCIPVDPRWDSEQIGR